MRRSLAASRAGNPLEPLVRKQVSLTRAQAQALRERARRERLSEAELLRRAVERLFATPAPPASPNEATVGLLEFIRESFAPAASVGLGL